MDELTPEQKFAAEDPERTVPRDLMKGRDPVEIIAELRRLDWSQAAAEALVENTLHDLRQFHESDDSRLKLVREARTQFVAGLLLAGMGLGITAFTWLAARLGALSFYVVASGLIFVGILISGCGWSRWRMYRKNRID